MTRRRRGCRGLTVTISRCPGARPRCWTGCWGVPSDSSTVSWRQQLKSIHKSSLQFFSLVNILLTITPLYLTTVPVRESTLTKEEQVQCSAHYIAFQQTVSHYSLLPLYKRFCQEHFSVEGRATTLRIRDHRCHN